RVGQADDGEAGQAGADVDLDGDGAALDPEDGGGRDGGEHRALRCGGRGRKPRTERAEGRDADRRAWIRPYPGPVTARPGPARDRPSWGPTRPDPAPRGTGGGPWTGEVGIPDPTPQEPLR